MRRKGSSGGCIGTQPQVSELLGTSVSNTAITSSDTRSTQPSSRVPLSRGGQSEQLILGEPHVCSMSQRYGSPVVVKAPSQRSCQASGLSQASSLYSVGSQYKSKGAVPWVEPLYNNDDLHNLSGVDRVPAPGGNAYGYWESPGAQSLLYTSVGQSQYGRPEVSGTTLSSCRWSSPIE